MKQSKPWALCVPTHNRKEPKILKMLNSDPELEINFFVRTELYETGFYEELEKRDRVKVIPLGYGLCELGLTRDRIMRWCEDNNIDYCCMFDDGIFNVSDSLNISATISEVFDNCVSIMRTNKFSDRTIGFSFHKRIGEYADGRHVIWDDSSLGEHEYFLTFPAQAVILNVKLAKEKNVRYKPLYEVGFEDCAFFADAVRQSLVYCSRKSFTIDGIVPNEKKLGGSHSSSESLEQKYDVQNQRFMRYAGPMMGYHLEKRYRSFAKGLLSLIIWNTDFFREVLCEKPEENKEIVDNLFLPPWINVTK